MKFLFNKIPFPLFFLLVVVAKIVGVLIIGFHYEQDTPRYLLNIRHLYNPPLYSLILRIFTKIYQNIHFVILMQALSFSFLITISSFRGKQNYLFWAIFWALEPISTFYCSNLMSEWLFIAILFACFNEWISLNQTFHYKNLFYFVSCSFLLYMTRYVGLTFFIFYLFYEGLNSILGKNRGFIKNSILAIIIFFTLSIPIRWINYFTFNTFSINAYDGLNWWNSASVLYPNSNVQKNPTSDFEKFLKLFPDSIFSTHNALMTNHMWMDSLPAIIYAEKNQLSPSEMNTILKKTAFRLIYEEPLSKYFEKFIIPNFFKPFNLKIETIGISITYHYIENFFGPHQLPNFDYHYQIVILLFVLILIVFLLQPLHFLNGFLIFYYLSILMTSAIFMRYLYVILPFAMYSLLEVIFFKKLSDNSYKFI